MNAAEPVSAQPSRAQLLVVALVPAMAVIALAGAVAIPDITVPPWLRVVLFLVFALAIAVAWLAMMVVILRGPQHALGLALPLLQTHVGGKLAGVRPILSIPRLNTTIEGVEVEIATVLGRIAYKTTRAFPRIAVKEPGAGWVLVGIPRFPNIVLPAERDVPTGDRRLDQQFAWSSDRPDQAAAWLADPEVRRLWIALLSATPRTDDEIAAVARDLTELARLLRATGA